MQKLNTIHAALLAANFVCTRSDSGSDDGIVQETREYTGTAQVHTKGDGLWGAAASIQVNVTRITIIATLYADDDEAFYDIAVLHDCTESGYMLYTDSGIESDVSTLLGIAVQFTEQGMQDEFTMSMELAYVD